MAITFLRSIFGGAARYHAPTIEDIQEDFFDAIACEHTDKIADICARHPDFNDWRDAKGRSPLHYAQDTNSLQSFITLLDKGASKYEDYGNGWTPLMTSINEQQDFFEDFLLDGEKQNLNAVATDKKGNTWTALHLATLRKDTGAMRELIENGADITVRAKPKGVELTAEEYAKSLGHDKEAEMLNLAPEIRAMHLQQAMPRPAPVPAGMR